LWQTFAHEMQLLPHGHPFVHTLQHSAAEGRGALFFLPRALTDPVNATSTATIVSAWRMVISRPDHRLNGGGA
jgi:hypothetical protein